MQFQHHANLTLAALRRWLIAQCYNSLIVGGLWLAALLWLGVPGAPFWALLAAALQFIPHFGPLFALAGPAMAMLFSRASWERWLWLLAAYAAIVMLDALVLQPFLMHRQNRVPFWASVLTPVVLGIVLPFWGVLLAAPLLAVIYAYRGAPQPKKQQPREQQFSSSTDGIILPPEDHRGRNN
jgi:predicted PurR-regulated permease PerM